MHLRHCSWRVHEIPEDVCKTTVRAGKCLVSQRQPFQCRRAYPARVEKSWHSLDTSGKWLAVRHWNISHVIIFHAGTRLIDILEQSVELILSWNCDSSFIRVSLHFSITDTPIVLYINSLNTLYKQNFKKLEIGLFSSKMQCQYNC